MTFPRDFEKDRSQRRFCGGTFFLIDTTVASMSRGVFAAVMAFAAAGCGGAAPLMHTAHALPAEQFTLGAGFSGTVPVDPARLQASNLEDLSLEEGAFAPGLAPWLGGRLGLGEGIDAGLTFTGRAARVDIRKAFELDGPEGPALSLGIGASGLLPKRRDDIGLRIGGFGADIPILFGLRSDADLYSGYIGLRAGGELLSGSREIEQDPLDPTAPGAGPVDGWHVQAGGLAGFRVGFRYIYAIIEVGAAMNWAEGTVTGREVVLRQFSLSPSGAIIGRF